MFAAHPHLSATVLEQNPVDGIVRSEIKRHGIEDRVSVTTGDMFLDDYNRLDVAATYRYSDRVNLVLSVDNLLDDDYEQAIGFPSPGARARLGLRFVF